MVQEGYIVGDVKIERWARPHLGLSHIPETTCPSYRAKMSEIGPRLLPI